MASYSNLGGNNGRASRDSLELASLASSTSSARNSISSSPSRSSSRRLADLDDMDDPLTTDIEGNEGAGGRGARPARGRSYSVGSTFDFGGHLFPLVASASADAGYISLDPSASGAGSSGLRTQGLEKLKTVTFLNGLSLVVGLQIGSGIFSSPAQVNTNAGSPGASLIVWFMAGVLAWTGAASYAELGGAIPLSGGAQAYLQHTFGDLPAFLFSWTAVVVLKPGGNAIIAIIFGEYLNSILLGALREDSPRPPDWMNKLVAFIGISLVTLLNCLSTKMGTRMGDVFLVIKLVSLLAITVIGIVVATTGLSAKPGGANQEWKHENWFEGSSHNIGDYAIALYAGLWAFDGWDNVNYITGEMKNPTRDLPRVIHTSMPIVVVSYILANMSYFFVLPRAVIASSNTIAVQFGTTVFGPVGGIVFSLAVSVSCLGALNATTITTGRLIYVAGREGFLPKLFGSLGLHRSTPSTAAAATRSPTKISFLSKTAARVFGDSYGRTPIYAMLLNATLSCCYILAGDFAALVTFYGVAGYTFYFLTVLGVIILRVKEPSLERPYRTWISTPIVFCCVSLFLVSRSVFGRPIQTLLVLAFVLAGIPIFWWRVGVPKWMKRLVGKGGNDDGRGRFQELNMSTI